MTYARTMLVRCGAELLGTFMLTFFGTGAVFAAALTGALQGLFQVAIVWAVAVALAIYSFGAVSGAHINPAVTLAAWAFRGFPTRSMWCYMLSQVAGAFLASALLYVLFCGTLARFERDQGIARGDPGSERTAMVFGEYFPNPALFGTGPDAAAVVSAAQAALAEAIGTALLVFCIFALTDPRNAASPGASLFPLCVGLTVGALICILAPLTQAGFNPARDFGPRLFAYAAGWGTVAIPGPRGGFFTVYILAPLLGGLAGGGTYQFFAALCRACEAAGSGQNSGVPAAPHRRSKPMKRARYIMIGGFLGAGKTTAILGLAHELHGRGLRVGLITNDQSFDLVDTARARSAGFSVEEITGGCFCCRFDSLVAASQQLTRATAPDVLIAEPVGSCTDLKATVAWPLRQLYGDSYDVAPLSVMVDPVRCARILGLEGGRSFSANVAYVYRKQLEEAELLVINKIDLVSSEFLDRLRRELSRLYPAARVLAISAQTGAALREWYDAVLGGSLSGGRAIEVDYDAYADGEARLGWVNARVRVEAAAEFDGNSLLTDLAGAVQRRLAESGIEIAHLKMVLTPSEGPDIASVSLVASDAAPRLTHRLVSPTARGALVVNLRAEGDPAILRKAVEEALAAQRWIDCRVDSVSALRPGRPAPTHRLASGDLSGPVMPAQA